MPNYPWLMEPLEYKNIADRMRALKMVGVPYSENKAEYDANVKRFGEDIAKNLNILQAEKNLLAQAATGNYDGNADDVTEMDALVAYLQLLGTMVDFSKFDEGHFADFR